MKTDKEIKKNEKAKQDRRNLVITRVLSSGDFSGHYCGLCNIALNHTEHQLYDDLCVACYFENE